MRTQKSIEKKTTFKKNKLNTIESVNENMEETEARVSLKNSTREMLDS